MNERNEKWIVLDIDGTLSMTIDTDEYNSLESNIQKYFSKIVYEPYQNKDITREAWVMPRPHLSEFLNYCFEHYHVGIWSIGQPSYVSAVVKYLFTDYEPIFIYNFTNCERNFKDGIRFTKPLSKSPAKGGIIIEDNLDVVDHLDKHIIIQSFDLYCSNSDDNSDDNISEDNIFDEHSIEYNQGDFDILINDDCLISLIHLLKITES